MTKVVVIAVMVGWGMFIVEGWRDAGELVYDKVQQASVESQE